MIEIEGIQNSKKGLNKTAEAHVREKKTALDVAEEVKGFIKTEYPAMADAHAMRLAILLTKAQTKNLL